MFLLFTVCLLVLAPSQYGNDTEEEGVVYSGEVEVSVDLDPGDIVCADVITENTSCTVNTTHFPFLYYILFYCSLLGMCVKKMTL